MAEATTTSAGRYRQGTVALLALNVGSTAAAVALVGASDGRTSDTWPTIGSVLNWDMVMIISGVIACLVARRQPENPTGWLLGGGGSVGALASAADAYGGYALLAFPGTAPGGTIGIFASAVGLYLAWALLAVHLPLRFPNGSLLSHRWRVVGWAGTTAAILCGIQIFHPAAFDDDELFYDLPTVTNPIGIAGAGDLLAAAFGIGILVIFGATFVAVASLVVRYRRAGGEERLQLKWVALAVTSVVISNLLIANLHDKLPDPLGSGLFTLSGFLVFLIPASFGVSILKYRLYGVDTLLVRAVVYGSMAAFVTAVYILVAVGVGFAIGTRGEPNLALSILATALVALAFQPVRERVQRMANRIVYGERFTPYEVISGFAHRMAESISFEQVLPRMAEAAATGVGAAQGEVRLLLGSTERVVRWPEGAAEADQSISLPVVHQGEVVGALAVTMAPGELLSPADEQVLRDLASQAGLALSNLRLTGELEQRLVELQASRQRIVAAQDEERRRMERDIHDGAQQQLVALAVNLGLAKALVVDAPEQAAAILDQLKADAGEALETLRDLARGLFPPLLADRGLVFALQSHINKVNLNASVEGEGVEGLRFEPGLEAAIYFCIREALQNASKHAGGAPIAVRLAWGEDRLSFDVQDSGPGFVVDGVARGSGLQNMADRVEALGGTFSIASAPDEGTRVFGTVPAPALVTQPR